MNAEMIKLEALATFERDKEKYAAISSQDIKADLHRQYLKMLDYQLKLTQGVYRNQKGTPIQLLLEETVIIREIIYLELTRRLDEYDKMQAAKVSGDEIEKAQPN